MSSDINQQNLEEQFKKLPLPVQSLVAGLEWKTWVGEISKRHGLNLDQASSLEAEVFVIMLGLESKDEFEYNLSKEISIAPDKIPLVIADINKDIFGRMKQALIEDTKKDPEEIIGKEKEISIPTPFSHPTQTVDDSGVVKTLSAIDTAVPKPPLASALPRFTAMPKVDPSTEKIAQIQQVMNNAATANMSDKVYDPKSGTFVEAKVSQGSSILDQKLGTTMASSPIIDSRPAGNNSPLDPYRESVK